MDEKGANTFPFHNLPPELKKTTSKGLSYLFKLSLLDKIKVSGDSCYLQQLQSNSKHPSHFSHRIPELATLLGSILKSGVTLGLDHLYLLTLFNLFDLHFGSLFGFVLNPTPVFGGTF